MEMHEGESETPAKYTYKADTRQNMHEGARTFGAA